MICPTKDETSRHFQNYRVASKNDKLLRLLDGPQIVRDKTSHKRHDLPSSHVKLELRKQPVESNLTISFMRSFCHSCHQVDAKKRIGCFEDLYPKFNNCPHDSLSPSCSSLYTKLVNNCFNCFNSSISCDNLMKLSYLL